MHQWNNLPFEILLNIFQEIQHVAHVKQCQLTCKNWSLPAQTRIYRNVVISNIYRGSSFLDTISRENGLGTLVRTVKLRYGDSSIVISDDGAFILVYILAKYCPKIELLHGNWTPNNAWKFIHVLSQTDFKQLEDIQFELKAYEYKDYVDAMLKLKHNMIRLDVHDSLSYEDVSQEYAFFIQHLGEFPKLKYLTVGTTKPNRIFELESFIDQCSPTLTCMVFTTLQSLEMFDYPILNKSIDSVIPRPSLKSLDADGVVYIDSVIEYIMRKFPQLDHLVLNQSRNILDEETDIYGLSQSCCEAFFEYLSRMKKFLVRCSILSYHFTYVMELYQRILAADDDFTVKYSCQELSDDDRVCPVVNFKRLTSLNLKQPKRMSFAPSSELPTYFTLVKVKGYYDPTMEDPPVLEFVKEYGAKIKEFSIKISKSNVIIKTILDACPSLEALTLKSMIFTSYSNSIQRILPRNFKKTNLKILTLENCNLYSKKSIFLEFSHCFPSLQYLEIRQCEWLPNHKMVEHGLHTVNMPGICFEELKMHMKFDVLGEDRSSAYLQINYDQYYMLGCDKSCQSLTKSEYKEAMILYPYERFHIICQSLKKLTLCYYFQEDITFVHPNQA